MAIDTLYEPDCGTKYRDKEEKGVGISPENSMFIQEHESNQVSRNNLKDVLRQKYDNL